MSSTANILDVVDKATGNTPVIDSPMVGIGGEAPAKASPLYLLASEIVDFVEFSEQYRLEELAAAEEGAAIEASGYPDPASDRSFA